MLSLRLGAVDIFATSPLKVHWTFIGGGREGKELDISMGHFWQKSTKYEFQECEEEKASTHIVQKNR